MGTIPGTSSGTKQDPKPPVGLGSYLPLPVVLELALALVIARSLLPY